MLAVLLTVTRRLLPVWSAGLVTVCHREVGRPQQRRQIRAAGCDEWRLETAKQQVGWRRGGGWQGPQPGRAERGGPEVPGALRERRVGHVNDRPTAGLSPAPAGQPDWQPPTAICLAAWA